MSGFLTFDSRGRITIPRQFRERLGDRVVAVLTPHGVVLHPVPDKITIDLPPSDQLSGEDLAMEEAGA